MQKDGTMRSLAGILAWICVIILVLLPFHAFITVWSASLIGHYLLVRLWKEYLLLILVIDGIYELWRHRPMLRRLLSFWAIKLMLVYLGLIVIWGAVPLVRHDVAAKAMFYGLLVDTRFLIFFLVTAVVTAGSDRLESNWKNIVLLPALVVSVFAVLQYLVLPYDFLKHFGYGPSTISPYETINHDVHHIRVLSTLRGANPLGAYLIIPLTSVAVLFFKKVRDGSLWLICPLVLALVFSFSRSAWIGAGLALLTVVWFSLTSVRAKRLAAWILATLVLLAVVLGFALRNNLNFENVIFHTNRTSTIAQSSNEGHAAAFRSAVHDIVHHPFGNGVGTAGPQSVYNNGGARIAENYFFQIGQEAGILAMALFVTICVLVGKMLYQNRRDSLSLVLLASLVGISFVNLLSHAWTDDTLAYLWWGLAGVSLAPILTGRTKVKNAKTHQKTA